MTAPQDGLSEAVQQQIELKARQIVNEDGEAVRWWISNHSCGAGGHGCCGGGKEIDRHCLYEWIRDEMRAIAQAATAAGAAEARAQCLAIVDAECDATMRTTPQANYVSMQSAVSFMRRRILARLSPPADSGTEGSGA